MNTYLARGLALALAGTLLAGSAAADWKNKLEKALGVGSDKEAAAAVTGGALGEDEIAAGLKQALDKGVRFAVDKLGQEGGFLDNPQVRIPMPEHLEKVEKALRTFGQDKYADQFVTSMNRAAERAVPEGVAVFQEVVKDMSLEDVRGILGGADDAATQYLREHGGDALRERMLPLVAEATDAVGVTAQYKSMVERAGPVAQRLGTDSMDLDGYVTDEALDGLYSMIAEQERRIRKNPAARTTDLLRKVFGGGG